ncbi:DUF3987 domain-containing protein [Streptomyces virginiae]|uniref:DUF3987 domain-containing protein n=1 Tax=Streptomyces virginiae TaxID=1961 RepID=UPI00378C19F2
MLATLLTGAGAVIGDGPHIDREGKHGTRLFVSVLGDTGTGRKGSSGHAARRFLEEAMDLIAKADPVGAFHSSRIMGGLSSGEGLLDQVGNATFETDPDDPNDVGEWVVDESADRRLFLFESEFASVLARGKREGNSLLQNLRQFWDGDKHVRTLTANKPRMAVNAHVAMVAHVTAGELKAKLEKSEVDGGTMNRFLYVHSRQSKELPHPGKMPYAEFSALCVELATAIQAAAKLGELDFTPAAYDHWTAAYSRINSAVKSSAPTPVGKFITRALPYVLRLAVTYAALDGSAAVDVPHLNAAEAFWSYCEATARHAFGDADPDAERAEHLAEFIADHEGDTPNGCPRQTVTAKFFGNRTIGAQALIERAITAGLIREVQGTRSDGRKGRTPKFYRTT